MEFPDVGCIRFRVVLDEVAGIRVDDVGCFFLKVHHDCEVCSGICVSYVFAGDKIIKHGMGYI